MTESNETTPQPPSAAPVSFFARLSARVEACDSLLCVGLDPHPEDLPEATGEAARDFCLKLIAATAEVAAAYKPNAAFFEALGAPGVTALGEVIAAIPDDIPVLLDVKRGDISSTARAYARAAFDVLDADAVTLNPYMGRDAVAPFIDPSPARGAFVLCCTSNLGARDLQWHGDGVTGRSLYEEVAALASEWNAQDNVGLVMGATQVSAIARVRDVAPDLWLLTPGVGAQGGDLEDTLRAGLRADGLGVLLPVSRGISRADDPAQAARELAERIRAARREVVATSSSSESPQVAGERSLDRLADALVDAECIRFGEFTLKSGLKSPIYIDLRRLITSPPLLAQVAAAYAPLLSGLRCDRVAALPYAALPIGTAISLQTGVPLIYPRREVKEYGTKKLIEGVPSPGEQVVVIDDLATTGGSKIEALEKLRGAGLVVEDVVVLIDRQSGAQEAMAAAGCRLHAVFTLTGLLARWSRTGRISDEQVRAVRTFLEAH